MLSFLPKDIEGVSIGWEKNHSLGVPGIKPSAEFIPGTKEGTGGMRLT